MSDDELDDLISILDDINPRAADAIEALRAEREKLSRIAALADARARDAEAKRVDRDLETAARAALEALNEAAMIAAAAEKDPSDMLDAAMMLEAALLAKTEGTR
jgi:hypothetical protein